MRAFLDYQNYVFDLYGTLISIHSDEGAPGLWRTMADWYAAYGAQYAPLALRSRYRRMDREERLKLAERLQTPYPEIRIEEVFLRMLKEAEHARPVECLPQGEAQEQAWAVATANLFRMRAREWIKLFPGAWALLNRLRAEGKRVWLLSNAQAVFTRPELRRCGLADAFDGIRLSSDYGLMKPDPRLLQGMMAENGMNPEDTLMIGNDWFSDVGIALGCGIDVVCVNRFRLTAAQRRQKRRQVLLAWPGADTPGIAEAENLSKLLPPGKER